MSDMTPTESGAAFGELLDALSEIQQRYLSPEYGLTDAADVADGHRLLIHQLDTALALYFELDPRHPDWRRIVTPHRKALGDNTDAIYFQTAVDPALAYRVTGNIAGAVYTSFTVEAGATEGRYSTRTAGVLNDTDFDIAPDGSYEIFLGGPERDRNWLALPDDAALIVTRHYFEEPEPAAADPDRVIPLTIEPLQAQPAPPRPSDESIAIGIRRMTTFMRGRTVEQPPRGSVPLPSWVGTTPNVFPRPEAPGDMAFAAFDAAYCASTYALGPDEALVITGRWPKCRFANVCLWNRFLQTYDFMHRRVGLNRSNTTLEADGSFRMVIAHEDPGVPNWLDTEGRPTGQVYWRFFLPEEEVETPQATVVKLADLRGN
jgi:hypothetical protein